MKLDREEKNLVSLRSKFVKEIEAQILSGTLAPGKFLPPERELAEKYGVSRYLVAAGILELKAKGFVKVVPKRGSVVFDYKKEATAGVLAAIMNYNAGKLDLKLLRNIVDMRLILETECARLAAVNRSEEDLGEIKDILTEMCEADGAGQIADFNYALHYKIAAASGNDVFAMVFKSFEPVSKNLITAYFNSGRYREKSIEMHYNLIMAIEAQDPESAVKFMKEIILQGKRVLEKVAAGTN